MDEWVLLEHAVYNANSKDIHYDAPKTKSSVTTYANSRSTVGNETGGRLC